MIKAFSFPCGLIGFTILSGLLLSSSVTYADDDTVIDQMSIGVPVSCNITGSGMNTHNAEIPNGTYQANIGTTTLNVFCNDAEGFAIYSTGYTGNEIGETNSNKLVGTSTSGNATIVTGLTTSTPNPDVSNWAMKLTATGDSGDTSGTNALTIDSDTEGSFGAYHTVPNSYVKVAHKNSATSMDSTNGGATLTTTYAAYISKTQVADTYSGQVIYTLVHPSNADAPLQPQPSTPGRITYYANASSAVGTMGQRYASDNSNVMLNPSNFSRTGYGFAGWSDAYDYATNPNAHFYGPMEDITTPSDLTTKGLSLYAVWIKSAGSIQNWTCPNNTTMPIGTVTALTDQRDNNTYAVAKLADGKCWMIENLRLDNTAEHNSDGALARGYGTSTTYGNFSGLAEPESANFSYSNVANSLYYSGTQEGTATVNIGTNESKYRFPRYNNQNTTSRSDNSAGNNYENTYSYGNYYTWTAAVADTTNYNNNNTSVTNTSICPAGWHLPTGGSSANSTNSDFWQLGVSLMGFDPANNENYTTSETNSNSKTALQMIRSYPNNFIRSGYISDSSISGRYSLSVYWSSTTSSSSKAYRFLENGQLVYPGTNSVIDKNTGFAIRCINFGS